jgi:hypothetical protein
LVAGFGQNQLHDLGDGRAVVDHEHELAGHVGASLTPRYNRGICILCV